MSFYGATTVEDIRVGYISPSDGYITGITVAQANTYEKLNPGTIFILEVGEEVRYLTIDQVNALVPKDLLRTNACDGLQLEADCQPTEVFFFGGNGVGAVGNPIIGSDGALLAIDIVSGGAGYETAPFIDIIDECGIGAGAVARAVIGEGDNYVQPGETGRGVVIGVIIDDPGNSYSSREIPNIPKELTTSYPALLKLKEVIVENPGINYGCPGDSLEITPSNGASLSYQLDPFGQVASVTVVEPGLGFTEYPDITLVSECGVNASFRPVFEVVRDPVDAEIDEKRLIQVTDLVGLKQTGYVDGRAYYGAVFYKEGVRYAGFYETFGPLVQVYDTLKESIDGVVTTEPSAIQRQGSDISSNDPRLNLPGTPDNLI
jgi:hypothetical protein